MASVPITVTVADIDWLAGDNHGVYTETAGGLERGVAAPETVNGVQLVAIFSKITVSQLIIIAETELTDLISVDIETGATTESFLVEDAVAAEQMGVGYVYTWSSVTPPWDSSDDSADRIATFVFPAVYSSILQLHEYIR